MAVAIGLGRPHEIATDFFVIRLILVNPPVAHGCARIIRHAVISGILGLRLLLSSVPGCRIAGEAAEQTARF